MRGIAHFILGNWPLKIGAVVLATALYGGVVLSQNTRTWPGQVPIDVHNPPRNAAVLNALGYMTDIQYRAPLDVASRLTNGSFFASIDLANIAVPADGSSVEVPVSLNAVDASVEIVDYQPKVVNVDLDPVVSATRPVSVDRGQVPEGLTIGPPQVDPLSVTITGARSRVSTVQSVVARVAIDASGLNVDQDVDLVPLDDTGRVVTGVQIDPRRAHVRIDVAQDQSTAQLPVKVVLNGAPASGYQIAAITVAPVSVTVSGEAPVVGRLGGVSTQPIDVSGKSEDFESQVPLDIPQDVTIDGDTTVMVHIAIDEAQASRTLEVGLHLDGADPKNHYSLSQPSVLVTLSGPMPAVDALTPDDIVASVDVTGIAPGTHTLPVTIGAIGGVSVDAIAPDTVSVNVSQLATPTPTPSPSPSPSPTVAPTLAPTVAPTVAPTAPPSLPVPLPSPAPSAVAPVGSAPSPSAGSAPAISAPSVSGVPPAPRATAAPATAAPATAAPATATPPASAVPATSAPSPSSAP